MKRRKAVPLKSLEKALDKILPVAVVEVERDPVPCCHGYFPQLKFRHPGPVGASYKPPISPEFVGDQRKRPRRHETLFERTVRLMYEESGELPSSMDGGAFGASGAFGVEDPSEEGEGPDSAA